MTSTFSPGLLMNGLSLASPPRYAHPVSSESNTRVGPEDRTGPSHSFPEYGTSGYHEASKNSQGSTM